MGFRWTRKISLFHSSRVEKLHFKLISGTKPPRTFSNLWTTYVAITKSHKWAHRVATNNRNTLISNHWAQAIKEASIQHGTGQRIRCREILAFSLKRGEQRRRRTQVTTYDLTRDPVEPRLPRTLRGKCINLRPKVLKSLMRNRPQVNLKEGCSKRLGNNTAPSSPQAKK